MEKTIKANVLHAISKVAIHEAKKSANSACVFFAYQPKTPKAVKKLRKF